MWIMIIGALLNLLPWLLNWLFNRNRTGTRLTQRQAEKLNQVLWYCNQIRPQAIEAGCDPEGTADPNFSFSSIEDE